MTSETPRHPGSDDDTARLLRAALRVEPPREAFASSLQQELEPELRSVLAAEKNGRLPAAVSRGASTADASSADGTGRGGVPSRAAAGERDDPLAATSAPAGRRTRRSVAAAVVAAAVVLAVAVWNSRPTYSWTSMVQALESQPWIESRAGVDSGDDSGAEVRHWFSRVDRVVVRRSEENVVWDDLGAGTRSVYRAGSGVLVRNRLSQSASPSVEQSLLSFLLYGVPSAHGGGGERATGVGAEAGAGIGAGAGNVSRVPSGGFDHTFGSIEVVRQSWRETSEAGSRLIELDVVLRLSGAADDRVHLKLRLDPATHLPQQCRVIGDDGREANTIRFDYPQDGPREVYEVGVPRSVVIRDDSRRGGGEPVETAMANRSEPAGDDLTAPEIVEATPLPADVADDKTHDVVEPGPKRGDVSAPPPVVPVTLSSHEMSRRLDELMARSWERHGVRPVETCGDLEFLRRTYLDLTGRVPTVSEVRDFQSDVSADRRERLVEQLLARRDHATHLAAVWRRFLLPEGVDLNQYGGTASFEQWLTGHFQANAPYDEVVRELLLAEGRVSESGPILFYTALKLEPEALAAQTARAFLGVRLECAQCHDHFFDDRWKQTDFWGYAAFFARISRPQGKMDSVSPVLSVKDSRRGDVMLPETEVIVPPRYPLGRSVADGTDSPSRREQLASWMTAPENPHFARATVNRVWAHLFGRGLVEPVDDMRSDNPSLCPEVLDELAGYFIGSDFDLRDLFRVIVLSETYQRSSRAPDDDPSRALQFAQMNIKSLTAEQLYDSIAVATRAEMPAAEDGSLRRSVNVGRQAFIEQFRAPAGEVTDYQAGIPQALTLMNGGLIQAATGLTSSGILRALTAPFFTDEQRVQTLYLATLTRPPDESEREMMLQYVTASDGNLEERLGDILWALLNSAEFTFNH